MVHVERHATHRAGWLRAAVLGANDGIVSTASLVLGVAASGTDRSGVLLAGLAGLVAGAMSMAAGEYVSVSSQADAEKADLEREQRELREDPEHEHAELAGIYVDRGLESALAEQVATQLMEHDALTAHARDELGITEITTARPVQAAVASALAFAVGAALPLVVAIVTSDAVRSWSIALASLVSLALLGAVAARAGGAPPLRASIRVTSWSALAMAATAAIGALVGTTV